MRPVGIFGEISLVWQQKGTGALKKGKLTSQLIDRGARVTQVGWRLYLSGSHKV